MCYRSVQLIVVIKLVLRRSSKSCYVEEDHDDAYIM